ncbi:DUF6263 family protein [Robiginitalea sp.]|uniref:DUF6263 family protein n=1 Tax=Robiginitalea sp. TaxID=1902411 RepID=UPI003C5D5A92
MERTLYRLLLLLCFPGVLLAQDTLGYKLRKGDVFTLEQKAEQHISQSMDDNSHELTNRVTGVIQFRVLELKDSTYLLEFMFNDLIFKIESSLQGVLLDVHSGEPSAGDAQAAIFNGLLNIPVQMELSRRGDILGVVGGEQMISKVLEQSGLPEGFSRSVMKKSLEQQYGSQALAESYEQMTYFYPGKPVSKNDEWSNRFEGKVEAENNWKLDSLTTKRTYISGMANIIIKSDEPSNSMRLQGTQQTTVIADRKSGFIREMSVRSEAEGISTAAQMGAVEIPTNINSIVTYRLIAQKNVQ